MADSVKHTTCALIYYSLSSPIKFKITLPLVSPTNKETCKSSLNTVCNCDNRKGIRKQDLKDQFVTQLSSQRHNFYQLLFTMT